MDKDTIILSGKMISIDMDNNVKRVCCDCNKQCQESETDQCECCLKDICLDCVYDSMHSGHNLTLCEKCKQKFDNGIDNIVYYQWSLVTGGIIPQYAKERIKELLLSFDVKYHVYIKEEVKKRVNKSRNT